MKIGDFNYSAGGSIADAIGWFESEIRVVQSLMRLGGSASLGAWFNGGLYKVEMVDWMEVLM